MYDEYDENYIPYVTERTDAGTKKVVTGNFSASSLSSSNYDYPQNDLDKSNLKKLKKQSSSFNRLQQESESLMDWLQEHHRTNEYQDLFVNMDVAMKYIHDHGYYITSFAINQIQLLNDSIRQVKFSRLSELPSNPTERNELVRQNIYLAAILQIGVYSNCLKYFTPEARQYLNQNFDSFSTFLPPEDVPYYKGIIVRGASIYYSSYVGERKKKELINLDNMVNNTNTGVDRNKSLVRSNGTYRADDLVPHNDRENNIIYASLSRRDAAFARALIYPLIIVLLGLSILLLSYLFY